MNSRHCDEYEIPAGRVRVEDEVKRSRFITTLAPVTGADAAGAFVRSVREEYSDATHNCWAWVIGPPGSTGSNRSSDDGEPGGTAGMPMLGALLHGGLGDVAAVVTRYYGGTKLGRGGLVRAYGGGVQHALREVGRVMRVMMQPIRVTIPYADVETVKRVIEVAGARITAEQFSKDVEFDVDVPRSARVRFVSEIENATSGRARLDARLDSGEGDKTDG